MQEYGALWVTAAVGPGCCAPGDHGRTTSQAAMAVERQGCPWLSGSHSPEPRLCSGSSCALELLLVLVAELGTTNTRDGQAKSVVFPSCMPNSLLSQKILISLLNPSARPSTNHPCLPQGDLHHGLQHHRWRSQSASDQNQEPGQVSTDLVSVFML